MSNNCQRFIRWYDLNTDELVEEYLLTNINLDELRKLLIPKSWFDDPYKNYSYDDPYLVFCYKLGADHLDYFNSKLGDLNLVYGKYAYFLDCDSVE